MEICAFVGKQLDMVIEEQQTPAQMFNPSARKKFEYLAVIADYVDMTSEGDIKAKFERVGEVINKSAGTVERMYYKQKSYSKRLMQVQRLIDERSESEVSAERQLAIHQEMLELTASS